MVDWARGTLRRSKKQFLHTRWMAICPSRLKRAEKLEQFAQNIFPHARQ